MMRYPVDPAALKDAHEWRPLERLEKGGVDLANVVDLQTDHAWHQAYAEADDPAYSDNPCTLGLHWSRGGKLDFGHLEPIPKGGILGGSFLDQRSQRDDELGG